MPNGAQPGQRDSCIYEFVDTPPNVEPIRRDVEGDWLDVPETDRGPPEWRSFWAPME